MLAIRIMQEQGIEVEALNFKTVFTCCQDESAQAARDLGVRLTVLHQDDDYIDLLKSPNFGYGKGANPCVDCRIYMFERAQKMLDEVGAQFIVSGEVVGQRPMSQKKRDLNNIAHHSGLEDLLLRPLSAKLLAPTKPEREGWVDRDKLYDFEGRRRGGLIALAHELGLKEIPTPSTGCALTEPNFSKKVFDLFQLDPGAQRWDYDLLKIGRHFRYDNYTKVVVSRNETENDALFYMNTLSDARSTVLLEPHNFHGPRVLVIGPHTEGAAEYAAGMIVRYAKRFDPENAEVKVVTAEEEKIVLAKECAEAQQAATLAT